MFGGGKYRVSGVTSTHEVEKHPTAIEDKIAQFVEIVDLATLAPRRHIYSEICCSKIMHRQYEKIKTRM